MGDTHEPVADDLNIDEQLANSPVDESFPDPEFDTESEPAASSEETASPALDAGTLLPDVPASAPLPPPLPPVDGGFTPTPTYQAPPPPPPPPQQQVFTPAQLRQGVEQGLITEDQMVEQLQKQNLEMARQEAREAVRQEAFQQNITKQLQDFRQLVPGWDQPGSPANQRATPAFQELLQRGFADDDNTRLLALERTFGTVDRVREARAAQTRTASQRPTAPEVGRRGAPPSTTTRKDPLDAIPLEEKRLYKAYIEKGVYADWNAVRAEIQHSAKTTTNPRLREKTLGLMK
jgi:hypothetical protein